MRTEYRWAPDDDDGLRSHARELVRMTPDVILVNSTPATLALQEQGAGMPVVFVQVTDPGEPGATGRKSHRLHQLRVLGRKQMAGDAQGGGAARHAGRAE